MRDTREAKTVAVKACAVCGKGLLEYDRFCRWCGSRQTGPFVDEQSGSRDLAARPYVTSSPLTTVALEPVAGASPYRSVSGPLVSAVIANVSASDSARTGSLLVKRSMLALISVPIWLIIILLSPFDAYAAAKGLLRGN